MELVIRENVCLMYSISTDVSSTNAKRPINVIYIVFIYDIEVIYTIFIYDIKVIYIIFIYDIMSYI